jgi:hypothetical protein
LLQIKLKSGLPRKRRNASLRLLQDSQQLIMFQKVRGSNAFECREVFKLFNGELGGSFEVATRGLKCGALAALLARALTSLVAQSILTLRILKLEKKHAFNWSYRLNSHSLKVDLFL